MNEVKLPFVFIVIFAAVFNNSINAIQKPVNTFSSLNKLSHLANWEITTDKEPGMPVLLIPDSSWTKFDPGIDEDLYTTGSWLIRTNVEITESLNDEPISGLFLSRLITAFEIYWDGILIARNGTPGINQTAERSGRYYFNVPLPAERIKKGTHSVIIRLSNYYDSRLWKWYYGDIAIGPYENTLKSSFSSSVLIFVVSGILFITFLFNLFLYIARQRYTEHLLFSMICLLVILDIFTSSIKLFIELPVTYIFTEYYVYSIITILFNILLPAFFIYKFSFPKIYIPLIAAVNLFIFFFLTNPLNVYSVMAVLVLAAGSLISLRALYLRKEGSLIIFIGILAGWLAYYFGFAFAGLATTMVISTSFSIAREFARKEKAEKEAQLKSARLENELLKKNINPHFVLNTLTSVIVWLRKDTNSAIKLIEALAEEFRMINQISSLKLIPINQEIDLCKAHLKIMSYRKGADYKLETIGIDEKESIPPMVLHTLVENGLTHGFERKNTGTFTLQRIKNSQSTKYILANDGDFNAEDAKGSTGFGAKYITGRLEESYPGRWDFKSNKFDQGWESIIEIRYN